MALALVGAGLTAAALVVAYYLLPLDRKIDTTFVLAFAGGLGLVGATMAWQVRQVARSEYPRLRALQAMAVGIPLFLLLFAATYVVIDGARPGSFTEPLSRTDALYFALTVFATVGFGDITPTTEIARVAVMIQMATGLIVVGLVAKVMLGAVEEALRRRAAGGAAASDHGDVARPGQG